jgi:DNA repair exonuclease SbcCD ATPase subunit
VNNNKLQGSTPHELQIGDKIVFGVAVDSSPPEFEYTFDVMPKVKKRLADAQPSCSKDAKQRKVLSESGTNVQLPGSSRHADCESSQTEDKIKAAEDRIEKLKLSLEEKEKSYENVTKQLEITEKTMESKLLQQKAELEKEKLELEKSLKELLTKTLEEKEECLSEQLASQKAILIMEKEKVEESLQKELNRKLELKDEELEERLRKEKTALENVISEKELQQINLQVELEEYKIAVERLKDVEANEKKLVTTLEELKNLVEQKEEELRQQQEVTKNAQEAARKTVVEEMEDEFSCIICQELFIRATTLACSHSFCEYCLYSWLNKRNSCPVCRCPVQVQPVHSIVLDNAIAKMVEAMDDDTKSKRQALLQERAEKGKGNFLPCYVVVVD